jgi:hypothetical protein
MSLPRRMCVMLRGVSIAARQSTLQEIEPFSGQEAPEAVPTPVDANFPMIISPENFLEGDSHFFPWFPGKNHPK